jgi:hypothetical protein
MTETGTYAWRLDTLDPLGGLAFASYRVSELQASALDAGVPAIFIGAPTFQPVSLTNRSVGLAASRRSFQAGLFLRGDEVGFPDLEDVIEFVRRCYIRGGSGGGSAPGGGPLPLPEGGPEFPVGPIFEGTGGGEGDLPGEWSDVLRNDLKNYSNLSASLDLKSPGYSSFTAWSKPSSLLRGRALLRTSRLPAVGGAEGLVRGAIRLVDEVVRRAPVHSTDDEELANWLAVYVRLTAVIRKMGIWQWVSQSPHQEHLTHMFNVLRQYVMARTSGKLFEWMDHQPFLYGAHVPWSLNALEWTDAIDDLHQWPVPRGVGRPLNSPGNSSNPTLLNFLAAFLANPPTVPNSSKLIPEIDLALFAAARIVSPAASGWDGYAADTSIGWTSLDFQHRMLVRLTEFAWAWLIEQLPRRVFGSLLEKAIEQTSTLIAA